MSSSNNSTDFTYECSTREGGGGQVCAESCISLVECDTCGCVVQTVDNGGPWGDVMDFFMCILPIVFLVIVTLKPNPMATTVSLPLAAIIMLLVRLMYLGSDVILTCGSVILGLHEALTPLSIMAGAITLFETMEATYCMPYMMREMKFLTKGHPISEAMLIFAFAYTVEGASGFGTPVALGAPMLVSSGHAKLESVVCLLVMNTFATVWGAVGTPIWFGFGELGLTNDEFLQISYKAGVSMAFSAFILLPFTLMIIAPFAVVKQNWIFVLLSIASTIGPSLGLSFLSFEFPALIGGLVGCILTAILIQCKLGLRDMDPQEDLEGRNITDIGSVSQHSIVETYKRTMSGQVSQLSMDRDLTQVGDSNETAAMDEDEEDANGSTSSWDPLKDEAQDKKNVAADSTKKEVEQPAPQDSTIVQDEETGALEMTHGAGIITTNGNDVSSSKRLNGELSQSRQSSVNSFHSAKEEQDVQDKDVKDSNATTTKRVRINEVPSTSLIESNKTNASAASSVNTGIVLSSGFASSSYISQMSTASSNVSLADTVDEILGPRKEQWWPYIKETSVRTSPIWASVLILILTRVEQFGIKPYLTKSEPYFNIYFGTYGEFRLSVSIVFQLLDILTYPNLNWQYQLLYLPFLIPFVLVSFITMIVYRRDMKISKLHVFRVVASRLANPAIALLGALTLVQLMIKTGTAAPAYIIGSNLAKWLKGGFVAISPLLGALGSFFSGSTTVSNLTFGEVQLIAAQAIGTSTTAMLALQACGASAGNGICLNNIIAACAVVGLAIPEGQLLKRTARFVFASTTICTVAMLAFYFRF